METGAGALRIALLGTRGIPASYGGFETFAEELSRRLVQRGHSVTVYGRHMLGKTRPLNGDLDGVRTRSSWTVPHKYLETPLASLSSFLALSRREFDVALLCNAANSPLAWILKLKGIPLLVNVDGIERKRSKWSAVGRAWYRLGEQCSVWWADRVIADARVIADYYRDTYRIEPITIAYGATVHQRPPGETLRRFGLEAGRYLLYVSRLEPENNALGVVQAYREVATEMPLVVVGGAPYASDYIRAVHSAADSRVIFTGFQFGEPYYELRSNCYAAIQATEVGGTHPALVEAMAYGNAVIANDVPEHREVTEDTAVYYPKNDFRALTARIRQLIEDPELVRALGASATVRAARHFKWEHIADDYERAFREIVRRRSARSSWSLPPSDSGPQ